MPEAPDQASRRHATWVALRTLRQRPTVVDHTRRGEPIYEVRSVRLVLAAGASHFSRLDPCAKCGDGTPGAPVLQPADLDRPTNAIICKSCVRASGVASSWVAPPTHVLGKPDPEPVLDAPSPPGVADDPVAELRQGLADLRAEIATAKDAADGRAAPVEAQVRRGVAATAEALEGHRAELAALTQALAETRAEVEALAESHRETARAQGELGRRLAEIVAMVGARPAAADVQELVTHEVQQAVEDLVEAHEKVEGRVDELVRHSVETETRVSSLGALADAEASRLRTLEERLRGSVDRMVPTAAGQGRRGAEVASKRAAEEGVARPVRAVGVLLDELEQQLRQAEERLARRTRSLSDVG